VQPLSERLRTTRHLTLHRHRPSPNRRRHQPAKSHTTSSSRQRSREKIQQMALQSQEHRRIPLPVEVNFLRPSSSVKRSSKSCLARDMRLVSCCYLSTSSLFVAFSALTQMVGHLGRNLAVKMLLDQSQQIAFVSFLGLSPITC